MELEAHHGSARIFLEPGSGKMEVGRGHGLVSTDRTISRRHVSLELRENEARVSFEVLGRNPVVVVTEEGIKKLFRKKETGDLFAGDRITLSIKEPVFFSLKEVSESAWRSQSSDMSRIGDPVKEFGLIVRGREFDGYGGRIQEPGKWNWFLEEEREDSEREDEEVTNKRKKRESKGQRREDEDEEWTGDSEDEEMALTKVRSAGRGSGYLTRSKSPGDGSVGKDGSSSRKRKLTKQDEDDETLGGFIADDNGEEEEMQEEDEEEEEDFDDEEEDD